MMVAFYFDQDGSGFRFGGMGMGYGILKGFEVFVDGVPQRIG